MDASRTALVQGWTDTRTTLVDWNAKPGRVVGPGWPPVRSSGWGC